MRKFKFHNPLIRSEVWAKNIVRGNSFLISFCTLYKEMDAKPVLEGKETLSNKKECENMNEYQDHYGECKKPDITAYAL